MEIKRPSEINESDIPYIESPFFASARIDKLYRGFNQQFFIVKIRGLDELVSQYMDIYLGRDQEKQSAYWAYFKSGGQEDDRDYDFRGDDRVREQLIRAFRWGKYLIVMHSDYDRPEFMPLFIKRNSSGIEINDQWHQMLEPTGMDDYMGFEAILDRVYPKRKKTDYSQYFSGGVEKEDSSQFENMSPEPWPQERATTQAPSLLDAIKEYLGRVARGEILEENLARYNRLLERARQGDPEASREMIEAFAGFGGVGKVGKVLKNTNKGGAIFKSTKEATEAANNLGFKKIKETVHGQAVFKKGREYITRDIDGHLGGAWKKATSVKKLGSKTTRDGTFSADLKTRIGD